MRAVFALLGLVALAACVSPPSETSEEAAARAQKYADALFARWKKTSQDFCAHDPNAAAFANQAACEMWVTNYLASAYLESLQRYSKPQPQTPPSFVPGPSGQQGVPMYPQSSCIGPVVNGECHGTILYPGPAPKRCYGTVLFGKCTGPEF